VKTTVEVTEKKKASTVTHGVTVGATREKFMIQIKGLLQDLNFGIGT
jgi:hypothetical protein